MAFWKRSNDQPSDPVVQPAAGGGVGSPAAQRPAARRPVRVSATEPTADFQTIADAIHAAQLHDTISIGAGMYREDIVVDKPLHFVGDLGEDEEDYRTRIVLSPSHSIEWSHSGGSFSNVWLTLPPADPDQSGYIYSDGHVLLKVAGGAVTLENCRLNGRAEAMIKVSDSGSLKIHKSKFDRDGLWSIKGEGSGAIELISSKINSRRVDDFGSDNDNGIEVEGSFHLRLQDCSTDSPIALRGSNCVIQDCTLGSLNIYGGKGQIEGSTLRELSVGSGGDATLRNCQVCNHLGTGISVFMGGRAQLGRSTVVPGFMAFRNGVLGFDDCIIVEGPQGRYHWVRESSTVNCRDTVFSSNPRQSILLEGGCSVLIDGQRLAPNYDFSSRRSI